MSAVDADVAVLGGGPGGYAAAFLAADLGKNVVMIDRDVNPGGVCLFRGCIPSKALLHAAEVIRNAAEAESFGVTFGKPIIDRHKLAAWKQGVVDDLTGGLGQLAKRRGIRYLRGSGKFTSSQTMAVTTADGVATVRYAHAILATGSSPAFPPTLGTSSPQIWSSTEALELREIPAALLVIGGGYIGLEMATVYAALGSQVTVIEATDWLLPGADRDLVRILAKTLKNHLHDIRLKTAVEELRENGNSSGNGIMATIRSGEHYTQEKFDAVLIATGRKPNSSNLGLETTGVTVDARGFVQVNAQRQTTDPNIYAIGDVVGQPMLAHKASHEGRVAAEAICGKATAFDPAAIPAVVFTSPELAWVGITEDEAKAKNVAIETAKFPWGASGRAKTLGGPDGLTKLILEPGTHRLLGCGIVGPGAGELIAEATLAIEMGANAHDLALTIHAHPTLAETLMEGAESLYGTATHIFKPRR